MTSNIDKSRRQARRPLCRNGAAPDRRPPEGDRWRQIRRRVSDAGPDIWLCGLVRNRPWPDHPHRHLGGRGGAGRHQGLHLPEPAQDRVGRQEVPGPDCPSGLSDAALWATIRSPIAASPSHWSSRRPSNWRAMPRRWSRSSTRAGRTRRTWRRSVRPPTCRRRSGSASHRRRRRAVTPMRLSPRLRSSSRTSTGSRWSTTTRWSRMRRRWSGRTTASSSSMTRPRAFRTRRTMSPASSA